MKIFHFSFLIFLSIFDQVRPFLNVKKNDDYLSSLLSLTETIGKGFIGHVIRNKDFNVKECIYQCLNKSSI